MANKQLEVEERGGGLLRLTLNRPEQHNALSFALLNELGGCLEHYAQDQQVRCAIITGAGEKSFCAGGDLHELDGMRSVEDAQKISRIGRRALDAVRNFPVPVAAALNGVALGGGAELALACDICLAAPHARLGFVQASLNLMTAWGGAADVIARCGNARGLDLLLKAEQLSARAALKAGLVDQVCEDNQTIEQLAEEWGALMTERSRAVLCGQKALAMIARRQLHDSLAETEELHMARAWVDPDHWEAVRLSFQGKQG